METQIKETLAEKYDRLYKLLVGKTFRDHNQIVKGEIVDLVIEEDHYKSPYFYIVLDSGERINTIHLRGVR